MAVISWGKPKIVVKKVGGTEHILFPDGVENSTTLTTTKGDKKEAKVEGGENQDVRYGKSTYALAVEVRATKDGQQPIDDHDGLVDDEYEVWLQPEDPTTKGLHITRARVSVELAYTAENGVSHIYTFDALKPEGAGVDQVQVGVVTLGSNNEPTFQ